MRFHEIAIVLVLLVINVAAKPRKKVTNPPCPPELLWKMILTAGMGEVPSSHFLPPTLFLLGFGRTGIRKATLASAWQSKLSSLNPGSVFSSLQAQGSRFSEELSCHQNHACLNSSGNSSQYFQELLHIVLNTTDNSTSVDEDRNPPIQIKWRRKGSKRSSMVVVVSDITIKFPTFKRTQRKLRGEHSKVNEASSPIRHSKSGEKQAVASAGVRCLELREKRKKGQKQLSNADGLLIDAVKELIHIGICKEPNSAFSLAVKTIEENYKHQLKKNKC